MVPISGNYIIKNFDLLANLFYVISPNHVYLYPFYTGRSPHNMPINYYKCMISINTSVIKKYTRGKRSLILKGTVFTDELSMKYSFFF